MLTFSMYTMLENTLTVPIAKYQKCVITIVC
jgi:hypothetical protein